MFDTGEMSRSRGAYSIGAASSWLDRSLLGDKAGLIREARVNVRVPTTRELVNLNAFRDARRLLVNLRPLY
jgi:hypothetical protein